MEKINFKQERDLSIEYNKATNTFRIVISNIDPMGVVHKIDYYLGIEDAVLVMDKIQRIIKDYKDNPF